MKFSGSLTFWVLGLAAWGLGVGLGGGLSGQAGGRDRWAPETLSFPITRGSTIDGPGVALCLGLFPPQIHMCGFADACTSGSTYVDSIWGLRRKYYYNTGIRETPAPNKSEDMLFQSHGSYGTVHRNACRRSVRFVSLQIHMPAWRMLAPHDRRM